MNQTIKIIPPPKQQTWVVPFQNESDRLERQSASQGSVTSKETPCLVRTKSTIWVLSVIFFTGFTLIKCFECIHWYMDMPTYIHKRLVRDNVWNIALEKLQSSVLALRTSKMSQFRASQYVHTAVPLLTMRKSSKCMVLKVLSTTTGLWDIKNG